MCIRTTSTHQTLLYRRNNVPHPINDSSVKNTIVCLSSNFSGLQVTHQSERGNFLQNVKFYDVGTYLKHSRVSTRSKNY